MRTEKTTWFQRVYILRKKGAKTFFWKKKRGQRLFEEKIGANSFFNCKIKILVLTKSHFLGQEIIILEKDDCQEVSDI